MYHMHASSRRPCLALARLFWPRLITLPCVALIALLVVCGAHGATMRICTDEVAHPPHISPSGDGLLDRRIRIAASIAGVDLEWHAAPVSRCLGEMRTGFADAFPASAATAAMRPFLAYPMAGGTLDSSRAVMVARMVVYRRKGTMMTWDGKRFAGLSTPVLAMPGMRLVHERLAMLGVAADGGGKSLEINFAKLLAGRADLAIGPESDGRILLARAEFGATIEALPVPFSEEAYYLVVSRRFYALNRESVERMWQALGAGIAAK